MRTLRINSGSRSITSQKKKVGRSYNLSTLRKRIVPSHAHYTDDIMRRVSSRQRLGTWDAFDASAEDDSGIQTFYETPPTASPILDSKGESQLKATTHRLTRKRNRVERVVARRTVTSFGFGVICEDVQLQVTSFLDVSDARSLMMVSKAHYKLVKCSSFLWEQWCHQQWPFLDDGSKFVDESTSCASPNYPRLLDLAADMNPPTCVDPSCLSARRQPVFRVLDTSPNTVQFTGEVGTGDRCIRANAPLARPSEKVQCKKRTNLFKFLLRDHRKKAPRPFVSPFKADNKVMLTPRHISYFEVSILNDTPELPAPSTPTMTPPNTNVTDCIAIGLSTKGFRCFSRMPGWDNFSYGYHGDDGGIFHASGDMLKHFGPAFGKGDTVGCGVDYRNGGIFFTLNGKFLGYAWEGLSDLASKELFPTVGVDSNAPIRCNFGDGDFQFNLRSYIKTQEMEENMKNI